MSLAPPIPPDQATAQRWAENSRRWRMLEGLWQEDLRDVLRREYAPRRRRALGRPDTTKCLFRSVISQLSHLYDTTPTISNPADVAPMQQVLEDAGHWLCAAENLDLVLGLQDGFIRFHIAEDSSGPEVHDTLQCRVVPAQHLYTESKPDTPDIPHFVMEWRVRTVDGKAAWTIDVLDIRDPLAPSYTVHLPNSSGLPDPFGDISEQFGLGGLTGDGYPYRFATGMPVIPGTMYHRTRGRAWRPNRGMELVDGSLAVSGLLTQWKHVVRDASWPTRVGLDMEPVGATVDGSGNAYVQDDEAAMLFFRSTSDSSASFHQFAPGGDPGALLAAIQGYAADVAADFDIAPSDIARTHTDARSGYAISITREGQRNAQRKFEPVFQRYDRIALSTIAAVVNSARAGGDGSGLPLLPETGWGIEYRGIPLSMAERVQKVDEFKMRAELGATSLPVLVAQIEGVSENEARERLRQFAKDADEFGLPGGGSSEPDVSTKDADADADADTKDATGAAADTAAVGAVALNGAQVTAAQGIVAAFAAGQLPLKTASAMLQQFFGLDEAAVARLLQPVVGFTPKGDT